MFYFCFTLFIRLKSVFVRYVDALKCAVATKNLSWFLGRQKTFFHQGGDTQRVSDHTKEHAVRKISDDNPSMAYGFMVVGLFMAILDIQIVASSIGELKVALGASTNQISWVQTMYLMGEVMIIPLTGFLTRAFSMRLLFVISCGLFTFFSVLCGMAWNIESMVFCRFLQGFFGGAMIPVCFASIFLLFSKEQALKMQVIAGMVATAAPTFGPSVGGLITTYGTWRWLFFINILPGILVCWGLWRFGKKEPLQNSLWKQFDYIGFITMCVMLGLLEWFLKKGYEWGWGAFQSITLMMCIVGAFCLLIYRECTYNNPILSFAAFRYRDFRLGCVISFFIGVALYGSVFLLPLYLSSVHECSSLSIGLVMLAGGFFQFASGGLVGYLMRVIAIKNVLILGLLGLACSTYMMSFLTTYATWHHIVPALIVRAVAINACFLPMTTLTMGALPVSEIAYASGLYNLMRNLGGGVGIALLATLLQDQTSYRMQQFVGSAAFHSAEAVRSRVPWLAEEPESLLSFMRIFYKRAMTDAFNASFLVMTLYLLMCAGLALYFGNRSHSSLKQDAH